MAAFREQVEPGAIIEASDGYLGKVEQAMFGINNGELSAVVTMLNNEGERLIIPEEWIDPQASTPQKVRLRVSRAEVSRNSTPIPASAAPAPGSATAPTTVQTGQLGAAAQAATAQTGQPGEAREAATSVPQKTSAGGNPRELRIPVVEERLQVGKQQSQIGEVRLHKTVEQVEETARVALNREDVEVQRVPVNQPVSAPVAPYQDGEWYVVPVLKEVLVVQKQLVVTEEVRIRKRQVVEEREVREPVRRERLDVENTTPGPVSGPTPA